MDDIKFKANGGVDPVSLERGYTALSGETPYSGESIMNPESVQHRREMRRMMAEYDMEDNGRPGFLGDEEQDRG